MNTRSLMPGMCNVPINMSVDERRLLSKLAFDRDISVGALIRRCYLSGLESECPAQAEQIRQIRRRRKGVGLLAVGCLAAWLQMQGDSPQMIRASARVRTKEMEAFV